LIGTTILLVVIFTSDEPRGYGIFYGLQLAIGVPIGVVAFFLCCLLWMGFDAPMHLTALRLVGVYALTDGLVLNGALKNRERTGMALLFGVLAMPNVAPRAHILHGGACSCTTLSFNQGPGCRNSSAF
jgi:hypothetical protein